MPRHLDLVECTPQAGDRRVAVGRLDHELGEQRVVVGRYPLALLDAGVDADARAGRHAPATDRVRAPARSRCAGSSAQSRTSMAWRAGSAAASAAASTPARAARPAASRTARATRSRPVTSSVTPCSTWSRALTSRNQNSPSASSRNSAVAAFVRPDGAARPEPPAHGVAPLLAASARAPAPPRRASGGAAGSSSRARRGRRCVRRCRPAAAPRRGAPARISRSR